MLELVTKFFYYDKIYTAEPKLFYKLYKWQCGLYCLLTLRRFLGAIIFLFIGLILTISFPFEVYEFVFLGIFIILLYIDFNECKKILKYNSLNQRTPAQIRTTQTHQRIMKLISTNGKALGRKEWKAIKEHDITLYNDLLCDDCNHRCYFYSLEIAKIIPDCTLMWGSITCPVEPGNKQYAHAVILRNGYIYDSNMRQSEKYEDFQKLYDFKLYKEWHYQEYSKKDFRKSERINFIKWCINHHVLDYEEF